jgi:predicted nucleic acid-binding protein
VEREEVVIDASVAIKWFTQEEDRDKALEISNNFINEEIDIVIPDLTLYEISNALRYNSNFNSTDVKDAIESIADLDLNEEDEIPLYAFALRNIKKNSL